MSDRVEFIVVLLGGLCLSMVAGYVNTLMIVLGAPPITHLTGSITRLSADLGQAQLGDAITVGVLILSFVCGAAVAGVLVGSSNLRLGRRYGLAIIIESALLAIAAITLPHSLRTATVFAASAAGLQNAMASSYRSLIIRTTHLTGVLTDIGFSLGRVISGKQRPGWSLLLLSSIVVAFVIGGVLGAIMGIRSGGEGLWFASAALAMLGGGYFILRRVGRISFVRNN